MNIFIYVCTVGHVCSSHSLLIVGGSVYGHCSGFGVTVGVCLRWQDLAVHLRSLARGHRKASHLGDYLEGHAGRCEKASGRATTTESGISWLVPDWL